MRARVLSQILGQFLKVLSLIMAVPMLLSFYLLEPWTVRSGFIAASLASMAMGELLVYVGEKKEPELSEAMISTVAGWTFAVLLGAIPLFQYMEPTSAVFESTAGFTTTGISMLADPSVLPRSLLFWRALMQWVGGLGILTFFIAVIRESGGASRRIFSAETHKTDAGSIRPSLSKSIVDLWKVYAFITALIIAVYVWLGMPIFESFLHAFSGISTGGFSPKASSIGAYSPAIQAVTTLFMFIGGVNFVLLYSLLNGRWQKLYKNSEFRLYSYLFIVFTGVLAFDLLGSSSISQGILNGAFQAASVLSSTGYATMSFSAFSLVVQVLIIGGMFVGGSVGSTAGGVKVFRIKTLIELLKRHLRSYRLPRTAVNEVKIDGEILESSTIRTISVLFFTWISAIFIGAVAVMIFDQTTFMGALSGTVSAVGNMGPVYMETQQMIGLSVPSKVVWIIGMIAGRLEMIPLLAIFNSSIFKDKL
ncbi:MAG: TrkH family potassium uptake protein [Candidatus Nanohalobium sp.]